MNLIFYTNRFIPDGSIGCAHGPVIFIRPDRKGDIGLLEHEKVHVRQWLRTFGFSSYLYLFSKYFRLKFEVEAFKEQLKHYKDDRSLYFAKIISEKYGLDIDVLKALEMLRK